MGALVESKRQVPLTGATKGSDFGLGRDTHGRMRVLDYYWIRSTVYVWRSTP